jgi:hypothetical protein
MAGIVTLTTSGLANIPLAGDGYNFTFIVDGYRYPCPKFSADFLSPKIAQGHAVDPTINEFYVDAHDEKHLFESLLTLGFGKTLSVAEADVPFYLAIAKELGNYELYLSVLSHVEKELTFATAIAQINSFADSPASVPSAIHFLALNFHSLSKASQRQITPSCLHEILTDPLLRLQDENSIFSLALFHIRIDPMNQYLFDFVRFEYLSPHAMEKFLDLGFEIITPSIWELLSKRLLLPVTPTSINERLHCSHPLDPGRPFDGIFSYLTKKYDGNVHDKGIVIITEKSVASTNPGRNVVDLSSLNWYNSQNEQNQWVCFDFQNMRIKPTHYSIRAYCGRVNEQNLKSWVIEASDDGTMWTEIDQRLDNFELNAKNAVATFQMAKDCECRLIRIRQTSENHHGNYRLLFSAFEIFGTLQE